MIRRLALALIAVVLVVPTSGSAQKGPLPSAGIAYVFECHASPTGACSPDGTYLARFSFFGILQLDGGSRLGSWGLEAIVDDGAFGPTPISDQPIGIPFPAGACALDICVDDDYDISLGGLGQEIKGSCSGRGGDLLWDLTCNFVMPGGLSGKSKIQVVFPTLDVTDLPCAFLCNSGHTDVQRWGFYMRNIPGV
jgi:hypothetical protein